MSACSLRRHWGTAMPSPAVPLAARARASAPACAARVAAERKLRKVARATPIIWQQPEGRAAQRVRGLASQRRASLPEHWQAVVATEAAEEVGHVDLVSRTTNRAPATAYCTTKQA